MNAASALRVSTLRSRSIRGASAPASQKYHPSFFPLSRRIRLGDFDAKWPELAAVSPNVFFHTIGEVRRGANLPWVPKILTLYQLPFRMSLALVAEKMGVLNVLLESEKVLRLFRHNFARCLLPAYVGFTHLNSTLVHATCIYLVTQKRKVPQN